MNWPSEFAEFKPVRMCDHVPGVKEFRARAKSHWCERWRQVTGDQDAQPHSYFAAEGIGMSRFALPYWCFNSREAKDDLFAGIAFIGKAMNASIVAIATTMMGFDESHLTDEDRAFMDEHPNEIPPAVLGPYANLTEHPDSIELAQIAVVDREVAHALGAFITRRPGRPPKLEKWLDGPLWGGLMVEPIQEALR